MSKNGPPLSASTAANGGIPADASRFVTRCSNQIVRALPSLLEDMFLRMDDALYDLADKSEINSLYTIYFDAMRLLRRRRGDIEALFLLKLRGAVHAFLSGTAEPTPAPTHEPMALMGDAELEETLAVANLISKAESRYQGDLVTLRGHLADLLGQRALDPRDDPLGPHWICNAFRSALRPVEELDLTVKLIVLKLFDKHVMDRLGDVYVALVKQATASTRSNRSPRQRPDQNRHAALQALEPEVSASQTKGSAASRQPGSAPRAALAGTAFENLQRLLGHDGSKMGDEPTALVATSELMAALSRIQLPAWPRESQESPCSELRRRLVDELRLRDQGRHARTLGTVDEDTLDLVFLLFEHIMHGNDLSDPVKVLVGRLQIPFVKVALLDKDFFSDRDHPARRLLNHLAELALGCDDEGDRSEASVYGCIERVVNRVVLEFDRDLALFDALDAEVVAFREREQQAAQVVESAVRREIEGRERHQDARRAIRGMIAERLRWYDRVPETVTALLYEGWQEVLLAAYERGGMAGEEWRRAMRTADRLLWSVQPKVDYSERRELLRSIPELLRTLRESLVNVSFDQRRLARWVRELQSLHMAALHGAGSVSADAPAVALTKPSTAVSGEEQTDRLSEDSLSWPPSPSDSGGAAGMLAAHGLAVGGWVEILRDDGKHIRVKLSWCSPFSDIYVFVDRTGRKALELAGADLAAMLVQGSMTILAGDAPIVDRAMEAVLQTLKRR